MLAFKKVLTNSLRGKQFRGFSELAKKEQKLEDLVQKSDRFFADISTKNAALTPEQLNVVQKIGAELYVNHDTLTEFKKSAIIYEDLNIGLNKLEANAFGGWKLKYLKNMLLLQDYDTIFRDFLQSAARIDERGLKLVTDSRMFYYFLENLHNLKNKGYNIELENLKIKQDYQILNIELYKNLKVNRNQNASYGSYIFKNAPTPLGTMLVGNQKGVDQSFVENKQSIILATTMLVKTPMKLAIFNQNLTKKLYGFEKDEVVDYVVRFESEFSYGDLFWVLPTQNKPRRLRQTRITDFNNVLRGNPYFYGKFDVHPNSNRGSYMVMSKEEDERVTRLCEALDSITIQRI